MVEEDGANGASDGTGWWGPGKSPTIGSVLVDDRWYDNGEVGST